MFVIAAALAPLSYIVTARDKRWPLVLLFAPVVHALVAWVGIAVRVSDRCVRVPRRGRYMCVLQTFTTSTSLFLCRSFPRTGFLETKAAGLLVYLGCSFPAIRADPRVWALNNEERTVS